MLRERLNSVQERPDKIQITRSLERHFLQTHSESFELLEGRPHRAVHIGVKTFIEMLARETDHKALDGILQLSRKRWNGTTRRSSV